MTALPSVAIAMPLIWAFAYVRILIHELGHLCAAFLVGWKPVTLVVGTGREKSLGRVGDITVLLGAKPFGGLARAFPVGFAFYRIKYLVYIVCGPLATALVVVSLYEFSQSFDFSLWPEWVTIVLGLSLFHEVLLLIVNLIPHDIRRSGLRLPSDGKQMWSYLTMKHADLKKAFNVNLIGHAQILLKRGRFRQARDVVGLLEEASPSDAVTLLNWVNILLAFNYKAEALDEARALIADTTRAPAAKVEMLDAVACAALFWDHPEFLPTAMMCIQEAMRLAPEAITLKGTKGALLIESGDLEVGMRLLEDVKSRSSAENDQAICSYYLAYAHFKKGDNPAAIERLRLAKKDHPRCNLAGRIEKKILVGVSCHGTAGSRNDRSPEVVASLSSL